MTPNLLYKVKTKSARQLNNDIRGSVFENNNDCQRLILCIYTETHGIFINIVHLNIQ